MMQPVEIRTKGLLLREMTPRDASLLREVTSDAEVVRYLSYGPTSAGEVQALIDYARASAQALPRLDYVLAIEDRDTGRLIGSCGLHGERGAPGEREVYFVLRRDVWGRGIAGEAVAALIEFGFRDVGLTRIVGVAHPDNVASIRVMARAGMTFDGEVPDAFEDADGWRAGRRYAILRPEPSHPQPPPPGQG